MATTIRTIERPPRVQSADLPPLLVLLHGFGSNEEDLMGLAPYLDPRLHIVSARGIYDLGYGGYAWYYLYGTPGNLYPDPNTRSNSLEVITKFVTALPTRLGTDPQHTYLMGFSQGAILSLALALTAPQLLAGVVAISGYFDDWVMPQVNLENLSKLDILQIHGTEDEMIAVKYGRQSRDALQALPLQLTYREYPIGHSIHPQALNDIQQWLNERLSGS